MSGLDWSGLMRAGMGRPAAGGLGLTPGEFWRLSPAELALMLGDAGGVRPMSRAGIAELMRNFPDRSGS